MELTIQTQAGLVEGLASPDNDYRIFRGVPYAEPPVGAQRFRRPEPKKPWHGVRPAKTFSPKPYQADLTKEAFYYKEFYSHETVTMSEDCLYLNIWTPAEAEKCPVLFWIHGGAFMHGYGAEREFDGATFCAKGVILVTINYRTGALGFFAHDALEAEYPERISGNYGLWDQIRALQWVRENIAAFGGDPDRITVAGQSAGAVSAQTLISCEQTAGWIHGAIFESGGGLPGLTEDDELSLQKEASRELMKQVGARTIDDMRSLSAEEICYAGYTTCDVLHRLGFLPNVDGYLLKDTVPQLALQGRIHAIPYLVGCTAGEMRGDSVRLLRESAVRWAQNQETLGRQPSYLYRFTRKLPGDDAGAFHSSELWYVFGTCDRCWRPFTAEDFRLSDRIASYWANFVKTGDPNGEDLPLWRPYTREHPCRLRLDIPVEEEDTANK